MATAIAPAPSSPNRDAAPWSVGAIILAAGAIFALSPWCSASIALALGVACGLSGINAWPAQTKKATQTLLIAAVVGLGARTDLRVVVASGLRGALLTVFTITGCLLVARALTRLFKITPDVGLLIGVGTAICGGSAIAAVSPVLRAKDEEISVALAVVFILNGVGLVLFPLLGHAMHMDPLRFGTWAALAIHDTSSVVGAAIAFDPASEGVATTLKLTRALWIAPVAIAIGWARARAQSSASSKNGSTNGASKSGAAKAPKPWFLLGFIVASALTTFVPALHPVAKVMAIGAHHLMAVALFFVGAGLTRKALRTVGVRPLVYGVSLWVIVGTVTLFLVRAGIA